MTSRQLQQLLPKIRNIDGVHDVHPVALLPVEKRQFEQQTLLDALPGPVFSMDLDGRVMAGNLAAAELLNVEPARLPGYSLQKAVSNLSLVEQIDQLREKPVQLELHIRQQRLHGILQPVKVPVGKLGYTLTGAVFITRQPLRQALGQTGLGDGFDLIAQGGETAARLVRQAKRMAGIDAPLLLSGETGTGKELVARACHQHSSRYQGPFMVLDCASISDLQLDTELFGVISADGLSFRPGLLDSAEGGTLYLDNVEAMSPLLQQRLLRFLEAGCFHRVGGHEQVQLDVRIMAASSLTLDQLCTAGQIRQDLYYRISTLQLQLLPLRQRLQELPTLATSLLRQICNQNGFEQAALSEDARHLLQSYTWPGNMRELHSQLLNAVILAEDEGTLHPRHFARLPPSVPLASAPIGDQVSWEEACRQFEAHLLGQLYPRYPSSRQLAKRLGLSHTAVAKKLKLHGIGTR